MATTVVKPVFVDTNVLVYANVTSAPENATARFRLEGLASSGTNLWISRQVLREYLATLSRPQTFAHPVAPASLVLDVQRFEGQFLLAEDGPAVTAELLRLINATTVGGKQIHDANIVATMIAHGIPRLLTDNVSDFRRFSDWIEVLPLVTENV